MPPFREGGALLACVDFKNLVQTRKKIKCKSIGDLYEQMFFPPTRLFGTSRLFIFTFLMTPPLFLFSTFEFSGQFTFFGIKIIDEK